MQADAAGISLIRSPKDFFDTLLEAIARAETRISLAALYLGTGEHEERLIAALDLALRTHPNLRVQLLFDGRRAQRQSPDTSTVSLLQPLLTSFPDRCILSLVTMPLADRVASYSSSPLAEVAGVFHMKAFVMDSEVIISGANLSTEYFVSRQDRYVHFREGGELADFFSDMIAILSLIGGEQRGGVSEYKKTPEEVEKQTTTDRANQLRQLESLLRPIVDNQQRVQLEAKAMDTWVFPTFQCHPWRIHQDSKLIQQILRDAPDSAQVNLATAYLNPCQGMMEALGAVRGELEVLTADPQVSHGFGGGKGPTAVVPLCYDVIARRFSHWLSDRRKRLREGREGGAMTSSPSPSSSPSSWGGLLLYHKPGTVFHAKGIWIWGKEKWLTVIGSSNYGERSAYRDLEAQAVMVTKSSSLGAKLEAEWADLSSASRRMPSLCGPPRYHLEGSSSTGSSFIPYALPRRWGVSLATRALKTFL
eukprot:CAMPEP_0185743964 /NCGR_PEP_ID=MMETSP1174-20130828/1897_1 /TAXON_ID=35687 /ORGANISM="Dictyocha speculum, Strain CCMP1381" /LENGTH=476 /DNA_ID=CAMNT_0028417037 /DNA_START=86 /DNA_END=1516 /DNA_ORIENTATION=+